MRLIGEKADKALADAVCLGVRVLCTDVSGKAMLYFVPLFLTPFADKLVPILLDGKWPSGPSIIGCSMLGIIAACIGLRAYYDGSYQRNKDDKIKPPTDSP